MTYMDTEAFDRASKLWVPEYIVIKDDAEAMALYHSLQKDVGKIKKLITEIVVRRPTTSFVLTTIGFYTTIRPKTALELVSYLQSGDVESFCAVVRETIFDALEERKKHLKIEGVGSGSNPGKKQVDDLIFKIRMFYELRKENKSWSDIPTVATGLVPIDWISIDDNNGLSLLSRFLRFISRER